MTKPAVVRVQGTCGHWDETSLKPGDSYQIGTLPRGKCLVCSSLDSLNARLPEGMVAVVVDTSNPGAPLPGKVGWWS